MSVKPASTINLNFSSFLHSIVIAQESSKFFDLPPIEKLEVFSDILQLDKWTELSKKARIEFNGIETIIRELENQLNSKEGQLRAVQDLNYDKQIP